MEWGGGEHGAARAGGRGAYREGPTNINAVALLGIGGSVGGITLSLFVTLYPKAHDFPKVASLLSRLMSSMCQAPTFQATWACV